MNAIASICKRELQSYFNSPVAYVVLGVLLLLSGYLFFSTFFINGYASMRLFFSIMPMIFVVFAPAITMRLLSEERKQGTLEVLLTMPVRVVELILAKFLAGLAIVGVGLIFTLPYVATVVFCSISLEQFDYGVVIAGYIGLFFMAASFLSVGLLASSLSSNQIVSFIIGLFLCFFLYFSDKIASLFSGAVRDILEFLSVDYHFMNISRGIFDSRDVVYYLSLTFFSLLCAVKIVERSNWVK